MAPSTLITALIMKKMCMAVIITRPNLVQAVWEAVVAMDMALDKLIPNYKMFKEDTTSIMSNHHFHRATKLNDFKLQIIKIPQGLVDILIHYWSIQKMPIPLPRALNQKLKESMLTYSLNWLEEPFPQTKIQA